MIRTLLLSILAVSLTFAVAYGDDPNVADVPVTKIVLFSSGVGYFEHDGEVDDDAVVELSFRAPQINDVLKSMLVMDLSGEGTVTGINYASRDPLIRALKSFAVDLSDDPELGELLSQLRGAEVTVQAPDDVQGRILGLEQQQKVLFIDGSTTLIVETILNLMTEDGIQALPLSTIQGVELADERLADELSKALDVLLTANDTERKPVRINFAGEGERDVRIGYVVETPIWKTSYRLDLSGETPRIQGWAIVENTSDADWSDVELSLVSGRPISFIQDLYTPLYMPRPVVEPELYASLRPKAYEEGMAGADYDDYAAEPEEMMDMAPSAAPPAARVAAMYDSAPSGGAGLGRGGRSVAQAGQVGELFQFTVTEPVTLGRRQSAMLPIINAEISAEKVSIYNANVLARHPLNGAYLTNDTGMKMLGGPMTVLDSGMYAGDAQIGHFAPDDKRLISFAVDLNVLVDSSVNSENEIIAAKIVNGTIFLSRKHVRKQTYTIKNKADDERQVIVEHPFQSGWDLITPDEFEEKTDTLYRFRVAVAAGEASELLVHTERTDVEHVGIMGISVDRLLWYTRSEAIPDDVREALTRAVQFKQQLAQLTEKLQEAQRQKNLIEAGQDRLRKNIETVGTDSQLGRRYLTKLNEQEDQIEQLDTDIVDLREQVEAAKQALADYLNDLNIN